MYFTLCLLGEVDQMCSSIRIYSVRGINALVPQLSCSKNDSGSEIITNHLVRELTGDAVWNLGYMLH